MQKKKINRLLKITVVLFFLMINLIELFRPLTSWPEPVYTLEGVEDDLLISSNIWAKFGIFGGQFAFFTNWVNWLFIATIIYGWMFGKYLNPYWKNALSVYLLITTIIFFTILSPFLLWGESIWLDFIWIHEHFLVTCSWLIYIFSSNTIRIKSWVKSIWITLSLPIIYFIFTLGIYIGYNFQIAVYPFLNYGNLFSLNWPLWQSAIISVILLIVIILGFVTTNYLFYEINYYNTFKFRHVRRRDGSERPFEAYEIEAIKNSQKFKSRDLF